MRLKKYATDAFGQSEASESEKSEEDARTEHPRGRRFYNRYFSSYVVTETESPDGKGKRTVRVYAGPIYRQELGRAQSAMLRAAYGLLYVLALVLFYHAVSLDTASNHNLLALAPIVVPFVFHCLLFMAVPTYVISGREMKDNEYRDGARPLARYSVYGAAATLLPLLAGAGVLFAQGGGFPAGEAMKMALLAGSAAALCLIRILERRVKYTVILPKKPKPADGVEMTEKPDLTERAFYKADF